jgi:thiamine pyrophosphate-dependent acetolactate synthase large subunit-like protein
VKDPPLAHAPSTPVSAGTVSARVATVLDSLAADVFGVMGNGNAWFLDAVVTSTSMHYTPVRHEAAAVAAADAYFRASGRLAVATTTYGPGYTNAITPLTEAAQARVPVLLVTGAGPRDPRAHDVDQGAIAASAGAAYFEVTQDDAGWVTREAVAFALTGRTAVLLAIPYDLADAVDTQPEGERPARPLGFTGAPLPVPDPEIAAAAAILAAAERPLVLAGRGAWLAGAQDDVAALASKLGALTTTSALAMGFFDDPAFDGARTLGVSGGFATEVTAGLVEEADVVLVLGARLNPFTTRFGDAFAAGAHVIQVDVEPGATNPRVDTFLRGDAAEVARALTAALPAEPASAWDPPAPAEVAARPDGDPLASDGRLDPRSLMRRLDALLPEDRIIVQDGGHFIGWAPTYLRIPAPDRLLMVGTAFQTIGLGLPSAVGAGRARPESTIVLCSGDGGALMGLADLETVVRSVRRGVLLIFNDAAYGAEVHQYGVRGIDERPMLIPEVDFAGVATALGAQAAVIRTLDDLSALETWLASGADGVFLADMRVSREVVAPYMHEVVAAATKHLQPGDS